MIILRMAVDAVVSRIRAQCLLVCILWHLVVLFFTLCRLGSHSTTLIIGVVESEACPLGVPLTDSIWGTPKRLYRTDINIVLITDLTLMII